jgi:hypothetical protein
VQTLGLWVAFTHICGHPFPCSVLLWLNVQQYTCFPDRFTKGNTRLLPFLTRASFSLFEKRRLFAFVGVEGTVCRSIFSIFLKMWAKLFSVQLLMCQMESCFMKVLKVTQYSPHPQKIMHILWGLISKFYGRGGPAVDGFFLYGGCDILD